MASVTEVREALRARLDTIDGLRAYTYIEGDAAPPAALVLPAGGTYDATMARGSDDMVFEVQLAASRAVDRAGQKLLDQYLDGSSDKSIKKAVEADTTLGGVAHHTRVAGWDGYGDVEVAGAVLFGTTLTVEVTASGT